MRSYVATVFFIGIFFSFGIVMNTADQRRFLGFDQIAKMKANLLYFWRISKRGGISMKEQELLRKLLMDFFPLLETFLHQRLPEPSLLHGVDEHLGSIETLLAEKGTFSDPERAQLQVCFRDTHEAFEELLTLKERRTPKILRLFLEFSLGISVIILAPEFAYMGLLGVVAAVLVAFLLATLVEIQKMIENPFERGLDDIRFDFLDRFSERLS